MGKRAQQNAQGEYDEQDGDRVAQVHESRGNHIFAVRYPDGSFGDASLPNKFKSSIWIRRGIRECSSV